jgi:poly(3-hydroxybutyrate) depolymerase
MRRRSSILALASVCLFHTVAFAQESVSGFEGRSFQGSKGVTLPYRLFKVKNPTPGTKYPLILFLHGAGERGDNNTAQLMANQGATVWASDAHQAEHPAYVIAPQCPANQQWVDTPWADGSYSTTTVPISDELSTALEIADEVAMEFEIDPARHYITGLSMGGYGTWDAIIRNPLRFAAAIPVCGAGDPSKADLLKDLPIWTAHGDNDTVVPPSGSRDMVMALETAGSDVQYSEYPGVGHDSWVQTYANEEIIDWLFTNQRPLPPMGGTGGMAGAGGGASGSGGATTSGAGAGSGGTMAGGAGGGSGGAMPSASSAGATAAGSGVGGSGSSETTPPDDDSGCSFAGGQRRDDAWLGLVGFLALAASRLLPRRRKSRLRGVST